MLNFQKMCLLCKKILLIFCYPVIMLSGFYLKNGKFVIKKINKLCFL